MFSTVEFFLEFTSSVELSLTPPNSRVFVLTCTAMTKRINQNACDLFHCMIWNNSINSATKKNKTTIGYKLFLVYVSDFDVKLWKYILVIFSHHVDICFEKRGLTNKRWYRWERVVSRSAIRQGKFHLYPLFLSVLRISADFNPRPGVEGTS
jgi:hypothetical protein